MNGYMFGKGVYLADMSSKSAGYTCYHSSGNVGLLLLCDAELGAPMWELTNSSYSASEDSIANGCVSTWGKGLMAPPKWCDAGIVHPSLEGVKMVSAVSGRLAFFSSIANGIVYSQIHQYIQRILKLRVPTYSTTSSSAMMLLKFVSDISSGLICVDFASDMILIRKTAIQIHSLAVHVICFGELVLFTVKYAFQGLYE